jgi:hypothetical protein
MRPSAFLAVIGAFWAMLRILAQPIQSSVCETSRGRAAYFSKNGPAGPESNTQRGLVEERMQRLAVSCRGCAGWQPRSWPGDHAAHGCRGGLVGELTIPTLGQVSIA